MGARVERRVAVQRSQVLRAGAVGTLVVAMAVLAAPWSAGATTGRTSRPQAAAASVPPARGLGDGAVPHARPIAVPRAPAQPHPGAAARARLEHVAPRVAPRAGVTPTTFVVATTTDSPLASATSTGCHDAANGQCSLRAAVEAANNLQRPVVIRLGAHDYQLVDSSDGSLVIDNAGGTTIEGLSEAGTKITVPSGDDYAVIDVEEGAGDVGATAFLSELTISGGASTTYGGGIYIYGLNVAAVLDHVEVIHNTATYGGGISCYEAGLWATDSSISGNTAADDGGGLYNYWCDTYLTHTSLDADQVTTGATALDGGGIYAYYGNLWMSGGSVSGDVAGSATEPGYGGGIYDIYAGVTLDGTQVSHDTVDDSGGGGGAYLYKATLVATGATFGEDRAEGTESSGGAISDTEDGLLELHHCTVTRGSTTASAGGIGSIFGGGGLFVVSDEAPTLVVIDDGSQITDNTTGGVLAYSTYGGVRLEITSTLVAGNSSTLEGAGGVLALGEEYGGISVALTDDKILDNRDTAEGAAGGVLAISYEYSNVAVTVNGSEVAGNAATQPMSTGGIGGIMFEYGAVSVVVNASRVLDNRAPNEGVGGGVSAWQVSSSGNGHASLQLTGDTIDGNVAGGAVAGEEGLGGGVYAANYTYLSITHSTIDGNAALGTGTSEGGGGGVYDNSYLGATITGSTIDANRATGADSFGGGIYTEPEQGSAAVTDSTIDGNAAVLGAGAYVYEYQAAFDGTTIADNTAGTPNLAGEGGGLYGYDSVIGISNSTITGNHAFSHGATPGAGGGIYGASGQLALYFTTLSGNAAQLGGGIDALDAEGTIRDSVLVANHAAPTAPAESDCHASARADVLTSLGGNVLSRASCVLTLLVGDVVTHAPGLGPLAANGGMTETMALLKGSPAIDAAHGDCLATDQRGVARPTSGTCDAGAYQHT